RADPLLAARGDAGRGAGRAAAGRGRCDLLRQHRRGGGRLRDEVRPRGDRLIAAALVREQLPRGHDGTAVAGRRRVLQGGLRTPAVGVRAGAVRRPRRAGARASRRRRGRLHRRARPGAHGHAAARGLPARRAGALPPPRHAVRARRDPDGPRAHRALEPDFVLIGKALSGGFLPVAAMATRREIFQRAVGTLERSYVHQSTFGRNRLSMAAGLATVRVIERDGLVEHAARMSEVLASGLEELRLRHEIVREIRTSGLMVGIELGAPSARAARVSWRLIHLASEGLFPQLIVIPLHRDHGIITMAAGKNDVIKLLPPLTVSEPEIHSFLAALDAVLEDCRGATGRNWASVRDIATATLKRRALRR